MINFILPQLYKNVDFNTALFYYLRKYPERSNFSERINIFAQAGNFPYSFWHGGLNTNIVDNHIVLQSEAVHYYSNNPTLLMFDFCNHKLLETNTWIQDPHVKMVLNVFKNKGHLIKVPSIEIKEIIDKDFPGYDYVIQDCGQPFNPDDFLYISLETLNNEISIPNKSFYPILNQCVDCPNMMQCRDTENLFQYTFSEMSTRVECPKKDNKNVEQIYQEILDARHKGYRFFEFGDVPVEYLEKFNDVLINLLIKPEYREQFKWEVWKR